MPQHYQAAAAKASQRARARESERVQLVASDSAGECEASERTNMSSADTPPITSTDNSGENDPPAGQAPTELSEAAVAVIVEGLAMMLPEGGQQRSQCSASSVKYI